MPCSEPCGRQSEGSVGETWRERPDMVSVTWVILAELVEECGSCTFWRQKHGAMISAACGWGCQGSGAFNQKCLQLGQPLPHLPSILGHLNNPRAEYTPIPLNPKLKSYSTFIGYLLCCPAPSKLLVLEARDSSKGQVAVLVKSL